mmetsp:Transcript_21451/g.42116  ORF Transcript_21451/g.42116 Transcript_21451/m.42116 type:complete len:234 (+) Transcript_21451:1626-2327(+)
MLSVLASLVTTSRRVSLMLASSVLQRWFTLSWQMLLMRFLTHRFTTRSLRCVELCTVRTRAWISFSQQSSMLATRSLRHTLAPIMSRLMLRPHCCGTSFVYGFVTVSLSTRSTPKTLTASLPRSSRRRSRMKSTLRSPARLDAASLTTTLSTGTRATPSQTGDPNPLLLDPRLVKLTVEHARTLTAPRLMPTMTSRTTKLRATSVHARTIMCPTGRSSKLSSCSLCSLAALKL